MNERMKIDQGIKMIAIATSALSNGEVAKAIYSLLSAATWLSQSGNSGPLTQSIDTVRHEAFHVQLGTAKGVCCDRYEQD
jgi:hypothetical protein